MVLLLVVLAAGFYFGQRWWVDTHRWQDRGDR